MINRIIVYDFETYWDSRSYTLSRMSPVAYIRDKRFYPQLMAVTVFEPNGNIPPPVIFEHDDIPNALAQMHLDDPNNVLIGHNASGFDHLILSEYYGLHPTCLLSDTIHLARWCGSARVVRASLESQAEYFQIGVKGHDTAISNGKVFERDFSPEDWENFKRYCENDVSLTANLVQKMWPYVSSDCVVFSDITTKMATNPVFVLDEERLRDYARLLEEKERKTFEEVKSLTGVSSQEEFMKSLRSATKFAQILEPILGYVPTKISDKKSAQARLKNPDADPVYVPALAKTDIEFVSLLEHEDARVRALVQARLSLNSSVARARTQRLLEAASFKRPVPVLLKAYSAHTSRYGAGVTEGASDGLQFQNLAKRNKDMKPLRESIRVPKGYVIVAADSSQIEARVLAYAAQQTNVLDVFANNGDPYAEMAANFSSKYTAKEIHDGAKAGDPELKLLRNVGKTATLGAGYGIGSVKFADALWRNGVHLDQDKDIHDGKAKIYHQMYRSVSGNILAFWRTCENSVLYLAQGSEQYFGGPANDLFHCDPSYMAGPSIIMPSGFPIVYPNLRISGGRLEYDKILGRSTVPVRLYGGAITENVIQSLAFQILMWQACRMREAGISIACNIHDSFASVVSEAHAERTLATMLDIMRTPPPWVNGLPLNAEGEIGEDFTIV